jgi:hypothetical protein
MWSWPLTSDTKPLRLVDLRLIDDSLALLAYQPAGAA